MIMFSFKNKLETTALKSEATGEHQNLLYLSIKIKVAIKDINFMLDQMATYMLLMWAFLVQFQVLQLPAHLLHVGVFSI